MLKHFHVRDVRDVRVVFLLAYIYARVLTSAMRHHFLRGCRFRNPTKKTGHAASRGVSFWIIIILDNPSLRRGLGRPSGRPLEDAARNAEVDDGVRLEGSEDVGIAPHVAIHVLDVLR